jgi:hypothetical protein
MAFETTINRSISGVSRRSVSRSSLQRTRLEWTVEMTAGRLQPFSPSSRAARVPTTSARYMWLWTISG